MTPADDVREADVVVVGGGPAGIAAATRAAEAGMRTIVVDAGLRPGGQIWRHVDPRTLPDVARRWIERSARAGVDWMLRSTVVDASSARGVVIVAHDGRPRSVRATRIVIATGARELFLPYPGWTLPNAMGAGGGQALLKGGLDVRGRRVLVAGSGPLLFPVAIAFAKAGARVSHVLEQASMSTLARFTASLMRQPTKLVLAARHRAALGLTAYRTGTWVERADGQQRVESVTFTDGRRRWSERCDLLCCSYGLVPSTELARLLGCRITDGRVDVDDRQRTTVANVYCAGESTGIAGDAAAIAEGEIAGVSAAGADEQALPDQLRGARDRGRRFRDDLSRAFAPRPEVLGLARTDTVICRCEDVRFGALDRTWTGRQAKLYTRIGMGACQGAVCGPIVQQILGWPPGSVRPPLLAPLLGAWHSESPPVAPPSPPPHST